jgi:PAS domain S-box-containing protein
MENRTARLKKELAELRQQLEEAKDTIDAIRSGQIDALVVNGDSGRALYTLKSADHSYRVFIEKMAEGAISLNEAGIILYSNSKFASMIGHPLAAVIGHAFGDFVAAESKNEYALIFKTGWQQEVKSEVWLNSRTERIPVQLSVNKTDNGEPGMSLNIIVTDLTHRKQSERQLKEKNEQLEALNGALANSNHDLQQFASVASHDLQEPLRKIQVFSRFLKDRGSAELTDQSRAYLEKIIASSNRMKTLIVDILTYSRLSADDLNFEDVDLNALFAEVIDDFELKISENNAVVDLGPLPTIQVNKGQMRQVISNLINNALKFTKADTPPHIVIRSKKPNARETGLSLTNENDYCRISILDNGIGFNEKYASSIFDLFEKLNPKSSFEGSGIGLAIAKKIIDKHHGMVIAKSKEGEGSEFNIILPFKQIHAALA